MNPLAGKPLRYLIGADELPWVEPGCLTMMPYGHPPIRGGLCAGYCNLFDENNTGKYGPYLKTSDTAEQYNEGQIDPRGPGWNKNLIEQFEQRKRQGFEYIELDNPDAYSIEDIIGAIDLAARYGLKVIAKNPLLVGAAGRANDAITYLVHPNVCGAIVEKGAGAAAAMHTLRVMAGKPDLPVSFVAFGDGKTWAGLTAKTAKNYRFMSVTYSSGGEYTDSTDILRPKEKENGDVMDLTQKTIDSIVVMAAKSDLARVVWRDRGRAPIGYIKGMAVCFGLVLAKLRAGDSAAKAMVRVVDGPGDVFDHYQDILERAGMRTAGAPDADRLRYLFVILAGLGMRESSGRYCCGRDTTAQIPPSSDTVEAGLFQQSWDSRRTSPELPKLLAAYSASPKEGFLSIFREGVTVKVGDLDNTGSGDGAKFQQIAKTCPLFAVEAAAIALRTLYPHWGPIVRREVEIRPEADGLFKAVQNIVDALEPSTGSVAKPGGKSWLDALIEAITRWFRGTPAATPVPPPTPLPAEPTHIRPWMVWAEKEVGFREVGVNRGTEKYIDLSKNGPRSELLGEPWCADFSNAALEVCAIRGTRSAMARSYEQSPHFVKLAGPAYGAIVTMWRGSYDSGKGHVFFYLGENDKGVYGLGGNQDDMVSKRYHPRNRIVGYFWPKSVTPPKVGKIIIDVDATEGSET